MKPSKELRLMWKHVFHHVCDYPHRADAPPIAWPEDAPWAFYQQASYVALLDWAANKNVIAIPDHLLDQVRVQITVEAMRQRARAEALAELLSWGVKAGIEIMPIKGAETAFSLWPEAGLRMMGDLDVLVNEQDADALAVHLLKEGFEPNSSKPDHFYTYHHHRMPLLRGGDGVIVEIHTRPLAANVPEALSRTFAVDQIWERAQPAKLMGQECVLLDPTLNWFNALLHATTDLKLFGGLFPVIDLALLIKNEARQPDPDQVRHIISKFPRIHLMTIQYRNLVTVLAGRAFADWLIPDTWGLSAKPLSARHRLANRYYLQHAVYGTGTDPQMKNNHLIINRVKALGARSWSNVKLSDIAVSYLGRS